ncbi:MAG: hypothetical protein ACXIVL_06715 [Oceanicaulis sp.]
MDLERLEQVFDAVSKMSRGPRGPGAWFAAYALTPPAGAAPADTAAMLAVHQELKSALGGMREPVGELRWIYAALLTRYGKTAGSFLKLRGALKTGEKSGGAGKLYAGGARAALTLTLADTGDAQTVRRFFAIRQAIRPPWWRSDPAMTDLFAASHAARGDSPESVSRDRQAALAVFESERATRGLKHEGARLCALYDQPAGEVRDRYLALLGMIRGNRKLRRSGDRHIWIEWAAQGVTPADLPVIERHLDALGKVTHMGFARLRLAQLVWLSERNDGALGAVPAMAAVITAQVAAIIAVTAATTAMVAATARR